MFTVVRSPAGRFAPFTVVRSPFTVELGHGLRTVETNQVPYRSPAFTGADAVTI